jgi:hypothetical protein
MAVRHNHDGVIAYITTCPFAGLQDGTGIDSGGGVAGIHIGDNGAACRIGNFDGSCRCTGACWGNVAGSGLGCWRDKVDFAKGGVDLFVGENRKRVEIASDRACKECRIYVELAYLDNLMLVC